MTLSLKEGDIVRFNFPETWWYASADREVIDRWLHKATLPHPVIIIRANGDTLYMFLGHEQIDERMVYKFLGGDQVWFIPFLSSYENEFLEGVEKVDLK